MIKYFCNECGNEIPMKQEIDILTGEQISVLQNGKIHCKQVNADILNEYSHDYHICKSCAKIASLRIDNDILELKLSLNLK